MQGQDEEDEEEKSRKIIMEKLKRLGIDANAEDLFEGELEDPKVSIFAPPRSF